MPTVRSRFLAALLIAAVPGVAPAQKDPSRTVPLPGGNISDAEILRRLTAQLGGGGMNPVDLADLIKKFGNGGAVDKAGLEAKLKQLSKGEQQELLGNLMKEWGGNLPKDLTLPDGRKLADLKFPDVKPPMNAPPLPLDPRGPVPPGGRPPIEKFGPPPIEQVQIPPENEFPRPNFNPPGTLPNTPAAREAIEFWEKNLGSLNEMPAVRDALVSLVTSGLESGGGKSALDDILKDMTGGGGPSDDGGFLRWLRENTGNWSLNGGGDSNWIPPGSSWGGSSRIGGGGFGAPSAGGLGAVGIVLLSVIGAVVVGLFFWKILPAIREGRAPRPLPGMGPWPVDPRGIRTRDELVKAFEYLSVLECGERAKAWNHVTIAAALVARVPASAAFAAALARIYALARYTPEAEPIPAADIAEARGYLCRLARVSA